MNIYRQFCHYLNIPPQGYLIAVVAGLLGSTVGFYCQLIEKYRELVAISLVFVFIPILVVLFHARGNYLEKQGQIFIGVAITFLLIAIPGYLLASLLAQNLSK